MPTYDEMQWDILLPLGWGTEVIYDRKTLEARLGGSVSNDPFWVSPSGEPCPQDLLEDYYKVNRFLRTEARVAEGLDALEAALRKRYRARTGAAPPTTWEEALAALEGKPNRSHRLHLLTEELALAEPKHADPRNVRPLYKGPRWAPEDANWTTRRNVTYLGPLSATQFQTYNELGWHFKDPLVDPTHGEYSHRIQWWLVHWAKRYNDLKITKTASELFGALANYYLEPKFIRDYYATYDPEITLVDPKTKVPIKNQRGEMTTFHNKADTRLGASLWMCLVDRLPQPSEPLDVIVTGKDSRTPVYFSGRQIPIYGGRRPVLDLILRLKFNKIQKTWSAAKAAGARDRALSVSRIFGSGIDIVAAQDILKALGHPDGEFDAFLERHEPPVGATFNGVRSERLVVYLIEKYWPGYFAHIEGGGKVADVLARLTERQRSWLISRTEDRALVPGAIPPDWTPADKDLPFS